MTKNFEDKNDEKRDSYSHSNRGYNYYGTWNLFKKETLRFLKVYHQTILSPIINALLLLAIFSLAISDRFNEVNGILFQQFISLK